MKNSKENFFVSDVVFFLSFSYIQYKDVQSEHNTGVAPKQIIFSDYIYFLFFRHAVCQSVRTCPQRSE